MLDSTQILARELISDQIEKLIEKYQKKAEKEKAKRRMHMSPIRAKSIIQNQNFRKHMRAMCSPVQYMTDW